jgi:hypothetical protein
MLNTYIYHRLPPKCFGVCYTSSVRPLCYLLKTKLLQLPYVGCATEYTVYHVCYIFNAVTMYIIICISSFSILKFLEILFKILNCSTLIAVGSCYSLCTLQICVFTVMQLRAG